MHHDPDLTRATITVVTFCAWLAGHYVGDHWIQTCAQACRKPLGGGQSTGCALWNCAKHAVTWAATLAVFLAGAAWWLDLPLRPGWVAAGMAVNLVTHFVIDLRTPLIWAAVRVFHRGGYLDHVQVVRPSGVEQSGPGTALFHMDQAAHVAIAFGCALLAAGPA